LAKTFELFVLFCGILTLRFVDNVSGRLIESPY